MNYDHLHCGNSDKGVKLVPLWILQATLLLEVNLKVCLHSAVQLSKQNIWTNFIVQDEKG